MSTRSQIGILHRDGTITAHYCHSDGYFSHNGRILHEHYQDIAKVKQLIVLGSQSLLAENIGQKHDFDEPRYESSHRSIPLTDRMREIRTWCLFYGRDRNELGCEPVAYLNIKSFSEYFEEYAYLWCANRQTWIGAATFYGSTGGDLEWYLLSDLALTNWSITKEDGTAIPIPTVSLLAPGVYA